jgi:hypothetical protein
MLDLRIIASGRTMPVFDLPAALGRRGAAKELGAQIDALIAFYDDLAGDCDLEDGHDAESDDADAEEASVPEWHTLDRKDQRAGRSIGRPIGGAYPGEDIEQDDAAEDDDPDSCEAGDDSITAGVAPQYRAMAVLAGWKPRPGSDDDAEPKWCGRFAHDVLDGTFAANDA